MPNQLLEEICTEVDSRFLEKRNIHVDDILKKLEIDDSHPTIVDVRLFTAEYMNLTRDYQNEREKLESQINPNVNLLRIGGNALLFGLAGWLLNSNYFSFDLNYYQTIVSNPWAITGFLSGAGLTWYDEITHRNIPIGSMGLGILSGGIIGTLVDFISDDSTIPAKYFFSIIGSLFGFGSTKPKPDVANQIDYQIQNLDVSYATQKMS